MASTQSQLGQISLAEIPATWDVRDRVESTRAADDVSSVCERRSPLGPSYRPVTAGFIRSHCGYYCSGHSEYFGCRSQRPCAPVPLLDQRIVIFVDVCAGSYRDHVTRRYRRCVRQSSVMSIRHVGIGDYRPLCPIPVLDQRMRNSITAILIFITDGPNIVR